MLQKKLQKTTPLIIAFAMTVCANMFAQTEAQLDRIAKKTCNCYEKKYKSGQILESKGSHEIALGFCMLESAKEVGLKVDISGSNGMESLGEKIGTRMAIECPNTIAKLAKKLDITSEEVENEKAENEPSSKSTSGKVKEVIEGDFITIIVIDERKQEQKFVWLDHFDGDSEYTSNPQKLKGQNITIKHQSTERYVPKNREYSTYKMVSGIEVKN